MFFKQISSFYKRKYCSPDIIKEMSPHLFFINLSSLYTGKYSRHSQGIESSHYSWYKFLPYVLVQGNIPDIVKELSPHLFFIQLSSLYTGKYSRHSQGIESSHYSWYKFLPYVLVQGNIPDIVKELSPHLFYIQLSSLYTGKYSRHNHGIECSLCS